MTASCVSGLHTLLVLVVVFVVINGNFVRLVIDEEENEDSNNIQLGENTVTLVLDTNSNQNVRHGVHLQHRSSHKTVEHFARNGICKSWNGRRTLFLALKSKLCNIRGSFIVHLLRDLCRQRGEMLTDWISELFDLDDDGYISHHEKKLYG
ncbi:hypothetical protein ACF0H5_002555 [Mactra antiquata]